MITAFECSQCGSTAFIEVSARRVNCAHCGSLFEVLTREPVLMISKGANVVFGKTANVEVRGDIEVQDGANVDIQGKITVLRGKKQQEFRLKLIKGKDAADLK